MTASQPRDHPAAAPGTPFAVLGLPASADVTDEDVRAAWRRAAAATHPDRPDGGDPERFAAASAAYTTLRTRFGRGEALADAGAGGARPVAGPPPRDAPLARQAAPPASLPRRAAPLPRQAGSPARQAAPLARAGAPADLPRPRLRTAAWPGPFARALTRVRRGRPAVLAVRVLIVTAVGLGSAALVGSAPATPALITGALTWLLLTARHDLGPRG